MTIEGAKEASKFYTDQAKKNNTRASVTILENQKKYPEFEWEEIENFEIETNRRLVERNRNFRRLKTPKLYRNIRLFLLGISREKQKYLFLKH